VADQIHFKVLIGIKPRSDGRESTALTHLIASSNKS